MKKIFVSLLAIIFSSGLFAQSIKLGGTVDILTGGKNISYMAGPTLLFEYCFKKLPVSITGNTHFYLSELSDENKYLSNFTYTAFGLGISAKYYPIDLAIEPYIGFGITYNINNISQPGAAQFIDNKQISLKRVSNNISEDFIFGLLFSANTPINIIMECMYKINKPNSEIALISYPNEEIIDYTLDFNSLFLRLGLVVKL